MVIVRAKNMADAWKKARKEQNAFNKYLSGPYTVKKVLTTNKKGVYEYIPKKRKK